MLRVITAVSFVFVEGYVAADDLLFRRRIVQDVCPLAVMLIADKDCLTRSRILAFADVLLMRVRSTSKAPKICHVDIPVFVECVVSFV